MQHIYHKGEMRQRPLPLPLEIKDKAERKQKDFTIPDLCFFRYLFKHFGGFATRSLFNSRSLLYTPPNYRACSQSVAFDATAQQAFEVNLVYGKRQMSD